MIPILLFFGLCFFGLGDCQDNNDVANVKMITISNMSYYDGYFLATQYTVREASLEQLASVMICPKEHIRNSSMGWACGNGGCRLSTLETFEDGSKAYVCQKHIDHDKFYYDYGVIMLIPEVNSTSQSNTNEMRK